MTISGWCQTQATNRGLAPASPASGQNEIKTEDGLLMLKSPLDRKNLKERQVIGFKEKT
jgi:hypothetical protein